MAGIPPPPTKAENGAYAWIDWYSKLQRYLSNGQSIDWSVINKAGSSLADIVSRDHSLLTNVQGGNDTEQYHMTEAQYAALISLIGGSVSSFNGRTGAVTLSSTDVTDALGFTPEQNTFTTKAGDPTTTDITTGKFAVYKNSTSGSLALWANDGGVMKSVILT